VGKSKSRKKPHENKKKKSLQSKPASETTRDNRREYPSGVILNRRTTWFLLWTCIVLVYVLLRVNTIGIPLDRDEGMFGYAGQVILNGGIPYLDVIEQKPPLSFYIYSLALLFVPPSSAGIHLFLHAYNFLTLLVLFQTARIFSDSYTTGLWVAFVYAVVSSCPTIQGFTASTEMFMLLPLSLSLLFGVMAVRSEKPQHAMLSGLFGALACWTKPTGSIILLFLVGYLFFARIRRTYGRTDAIFKALVYPLAWLTGSIGISILIVGYFFVSQVFDEFLYWSFVHGYHYSKEVTLSWRSLHQAWKWLMEIVKGNPVVVVVGLGCALAALMRREKKGAFALGFLIFSILATIPGYAYRHYFAQLAPALAFFGGFGLSSLDDLRKTRSGMTGLLLISVLAVLVFPVAVHHGYYLSKSPVEFTRDFFGLNPFPESVDLAEFIKRQTQEDDSVFVVGSEPQILFYSERKSATAFAMIYPLMRSFPRYMEFQQRAWEEIEKNTPSYIITMKFGESILWDGKADLWIYRKLGEKLKKDYFLEAVMTVEKPKGKLLLTAELVKYAQVYRELKYPIYIYRKRMENP